jgi:ketosteroid isomerase-like protein
MASELRAASNEWMLAAQHRDSAALERIMAPEFALVHPSTDSVTLRATWLGALKRLDTKSFRYEHLRVIAYGESLALVTAIFVVDATTNGQPFPPVTSVVDVWEQRSGRWMVVTRFATRPQELGPRPSQSEP